MTRTSFIPKARPDHPSLDYELLRAEGISHLENLATEIWTDFNAHDPGITLLELLCYAITDLGYRTRMLPIGDLVAGGPEKAFFEATEILPGGPVTARDYRKLLIDLRGVKNAWVEKHTDPVLFRDKNGDHVLYLAEDKFRFRKIGAQNGNVWMPDTDAIRAFVQTFYPEKEKGETDDQYATRMEEKTQVVATWVVSGLTPSMLKNLSVENKELARALLCRFGYFPVEKGPAPQSGTFALNGLMRIILDLDDHIDPENESQTRPVVECVMERLQANRFLTHDYVEPPVIVGRLPVAVCLHLEVASGKNDVEVAAEALWRIEQHLTPMLRFHTFKEMRAKGYGVEEVYNGPLLDNGFLDDKEVDAAQLRDKFAHSDLTNAATVKPDVLAVHELKVKISPDKSFKTQTTYTIFTPGSTDITNPDPTKGPRPLKPVLDLCASCVFVTQNGVRREIPYSALKEPLRLRRILAECSEPPGGLESPPGSRRPDLTEYRSIQYDLPSVYAVGDYGVALHTPAHKKGVRKQLQAYLAFFDQILAAYLLQLGQVRQLLAVHQDASLPTYLTADLQDVPGLAEIMDPNKPFAAESPATRQDRRNRLLDHLLARFGESFSDYLIGLLRADTAAADNPFQMDLEDYLRAKADFLREMPGLGADRGRAYNYRGPHTWNTGNVAGVKKRVHRALALQGSWHTQTLLIKPAYRLDVLTVLGKQGAKQHQIIFRVLPEYLPADAEKPYGTTPLRSNRYTSPKMAQDKREQLNSDLWNKDLYSVGPHPRETNRWAVLFSPANTPELYGEPLSQAEAGDMLAYIQALVSFKPTGDKDGFHVLEHILLRPNDPADELLRLSLGCDPQQTPRDPYSNWLTVVLPNWSDKFADKRFQTAFEQTFRKEMPAEAAVRFCWVDKEKMREFEERYMAWMQAKATCTPDECHVTAAANELVRWLNETPCSCSCDKCCDSDPACDDCKEC
ncbi:MAG: hypothetical protein IPM98_12250 [Lewinellaceae bacterium]|nr:hypothetical protein [Lewinellaceae bacterium]